MGQWSIPGIASSKDVVGRSSNEGDILSVYGSKWKFADQRSHQAIHSPEPRQDDRFSMSADPMSESLLRSMDLSSLQNLAAGIGVPKIGTDKEELIQHIKNKGNVLPDSDEQPRKRK